MTRAAVLREVGRPLEICDLELAPPGTDEVRVKMLASGVCHSDVSIAQGSARVPLPMVLGHEGCGVVVEVGTGVDHVVPGDRVVMGPGLECGRCYYCRRDQPELCEVRRAALPSGGLADGTTRFALDGQPVHQFVFSGTFADETVVSKYSAIKVPDDVPVTAAAVMACAVATGFGAAINVARIAAGDTVVVIGCGGVGLNTIQGARHRRAGAIIAVDVAPDKLAVATSFGATATIDAGAVDVVEAVREATGGRGADLVFEVTGRPSGALTAVQATRPGGQTLLIGAPPADARLDLQVQDILSNERRVLGVSYGATSLRRDSPLLVDLYRSGELRLDELVSHTLRLPEVNEAFELLERGAATRPMIVFDDVPG